MVPDMRLCPDDIKESIDAFVQEGRATGSFLRAVLANNLLDAMGRADIENIEVLPHICAYIYNEIPSACHGSYEIVDAWLERKRAELEKKQ